MQPCPKAIANFSGTMHTCWDVLPVQSMAGHYSKLLSQRLCIWGAVGGDKVLGHRRPSMNVYELIAWYQHQDSAEDWPVRTCWGWALEFKNWTWEEIFTSPAIYSKISIVLPYIQKYLYSPNKCLLSTYCEPGIGLTSGKSGGSGLTNV